VGRQLGGTENDIKAKARTTSAATTPGAVSMANRGPTKGSNPPAADKGNTVVRSRLHQMESDIKAKNRTTKAATTPGAVSMESTSLPSKKGLDPVEASNQEEQPQMEDIRKKTEAAFGARSVVTSVDPINPALEPFESVSDSEMREPMLTDKSAEFQFIPNVDHKAPEYDSNVHTSMTSPSDVPVITTADHGVVSAPQPEYGVTGYSGPNPLPGDEDLAVAIAITEEDEDVYYPSAVEYDPDSKPPLLNNRRFRLYAGLGVFLCVLATGLVIAAIVLLRGKPIEKPPEPTFSPTKVFEDFAYASSGNTPTSSPRNIKKLVEQLSNEVGDAVSEVGTMEYLAARWIIYDDPMELYWYDPTLIQRYLLSLFYFKTTNGGESPWRSCNQPRPQDNSTCQHLRFNRLINDTIEYKPEDAIRWLSEEHECDWIGCVCDDNKVIRALNLVGQNMTGSLPTNLVELPLLQSIRVAYNELSGTLPAVYASMRQLLNLEVHGNKFTGTFPNEYFEAKSLQNLNIGQNYFTGTLSSDFARLTNLKGLHTFSNLFTGAIPSEVFNLEYLSFTRHNDNILNGTIPSSVGKMSQLQEIWLSSNQLTGTIPSEVGLMTNLIYFKVNWNKLTGSIPNELYNAKYLMTLDVFSNYLTGTLDDRIKNLSDLKYLYLSRNRLGGNITTALESLSQLNLAWLHLNRFEGEVPQGLCDKNMEILQADCFPRRNAPNPCECCTACCRRNTELCLIIDDDLELEFI